ncbi:hypothetical protein EAH79_07510 [Sphingomonas koreensis]|nr:hypothetical protein EAH79_07510 [Sphingomonas koreensis]
MAMMSAAPAAANDVAFQLSLQVPVTCAIEDVQSLDSELGILEVEANCNAESFQLVMGGDLGEMVPESVTVSNGVATELGGGLIAVHARRPGTFVFQLDYGDSLASVTSGSAYIQAI